MYSFRGFSCTTASMHSTFQTVEIVNSGWCSEHLHTIEVWGEPVSFHVYPDSAIKSGGSLHSVSGKEFATLSM